MHESCFYTKCGVCQETFNGKGFTCFLPLKDDIVFIDSPDVECGGDCVAPSADCDEWPQLVHDMFSLAYIFSTQQ